MHSQEPISLVAIGPERRIVLENLFELYCYDFSEQLPLELKASGRFEIPLDEAWWKRDDHFPFFIMAGSALVGFALARRGSRVSGAAEVMDVAEFFVVRGSRGRGVGARAAQALFAELPSRWEVRVRASNLGALRFWGRAVQGWLGRTLEPASFSLEGVPWHVLSVPTRVGSPP